MQKGFLFNLFFWNGWIWKNEWQWGPNAKIFKIYGFFINKILCDNFFKNVIYTNIDVSIILGLWKLQRLRSSWRVEVIWKIICIQNWFTTSRNMCTHPWWLVLNGQPSAIRSVFLTLKFLTVEKAKGPLLFLFEIFFTWPHRRNPPVSSSKFLSGWPGFNLTLIIFAAILQFFQQGAKQFEHCLSRLEKVLDVLITQTGIHINTEYILLQE